VGVVAGLLAFIGRNHGLYAVCASLGVIVYLGIGRNAHPIGRALAALAAGVAVGYLPVVAMLVATRDFAPAFWESIRLLLEYGATNIPLPVPWPWRVDFRQLGGIDALRLMIIGVLFCLLPAYGVLGVAYAFRERFRGGMAPPAIVATAFAALPYAHYAFSRADVGHLALGIFPLLIGVLVLLTRVRPGWRIGGATALLAATALVALPQHPGWHALRNPGWIETRVGHDRLTIDAGTAGDLALLARLESAHASGGRAFYATPYWPGAYAALEKRSPAWEIYALIPRSEAFQRAEVERLGPRGTRIRGHPGSRARWARAAAFPLDAPAHRPLRARELRAVARCRPKRTLQGLCTQPTEVKSSPKCARTNGRPSADVRPATQSGGDCADLR